MAKVTGPWTLPKPTNLVSMSPILIKSRCGRFSYESYRRAYQDLKQELGLGHYEGRGWRGFHHHASLSIAAYGFLMAQQLRHSEEGAKKKSASGKEPALSAVPTQCA